MTIRSHPHAWPLRAIDLTVCALAALLSFAIFMSAGDDFSYDYGNYLGYLERLGENSAQELQSNLETFLPYPYVLVPPAGLFEIGFATLAWALMASGLSAASTFAAIGATSIALRVLLLRALGLRWDFVGLVTVYTVTLFEANAIRLGCALTLTLAALVALSRQRTTQAIAWLALAGLFHIQSLAFSIPLLTAFTLHRLIDRTILSRVAMFALVVGGSMAMTLIVQSLEFAKLGDYAESTSGATGLTVVSVLALLNLVCAAAVFAAPARGMTASDSARRRTWHSALLATVPAVALLWLATSMGALGDRVWQFAFAGLIGTIGLIDTHPDAMGTFPRRALTVLLGLCLAISIINITVRYPLSNFFAPIIPHAPITPFSLVV